MKYPKADSKAIDGLLDFIYPAYCLVCGNRADDSNKLLCSKCISLTTMFAQPICLNCRQILSDKGKCPICPGNETIPVFALGDYKSPLKDIIHSFKYEGFEILGEYLAFNLLETYQDTLLTLNIDFCLPVPLDSKRKKYRGFNQAQVLSDKISRELSLPDMPAAIVKSRKTKDQTRLNPQERSANMQGAFILGDVDVKGKKIAIIDDVITTGATLGEMRRVVVENEGQVVCAIVAASSHD